MEAAALEKSPATSADWTAMRARLAYFEQHQPYRDYR